MIAAYLAIAIPNQLVNLFIAIFVLYLLGTAWLTVRRKAHTAGFSEKFALFIAVCLCAPFAILSFQLVMGMTPLFESAVPFKGPVLIAIYIFTTVLGLAAVGDARVVMNTGISGSPRIVRHLWRMCLGLTLATGSAFTNGFARLLPGPYHVPPLFFYPHAIRTAGVVALLDDARAVHGVDLLQSGAAGKRRRNKSHENKKCGSRIPISSP
jgi:hypothetical protein